ncbi:MAG TPA: HAMP domain-containing sensor histidine kinase [Chloroflexota bacterium]
MLRRSRRPVAPVETLSRLRQVLLGLAVLALAVTLVRLLGAQAAAPAQRGAGAVALLLLAGWWLWGCRTGRLPAAALPLEVAALLAASGALGGPLTVPGLLAAGVGFRSTYGRGLKGLLPSLWWALLLAAGQRLAPLYAAPGREAPAWQLAALALGPTMWLLAESLRRHDEILAGQRALAQAAAAVVAATSREEVLSAALGGARQLLGGRPAHVLPAEPAHSVGTVLPLDGHAGRQGLLVVDDGGEPVPELCRQPLEALCILTALRLEGLEQAQARQRRAESRAAELSELNALKDELLNSVSLELRTPLAAIRGYSEVLLSRELDTPHGRLARAINTESERLSRLVSGMLDLTQLQWGSFVWHMAPLDVLDLLWDTAAIYRPLITREGLAFDVGAEPGLPLVMGDRDRLLQVLGNLLHNALKFTARGSLGLAAYRAGQEVHIAVSDSGVGVPEAERERIFDGPPGAGRAPGASASGLGLAICRRIAEQHGGRLWVSAGPRGGSVFSLALPAAVESPTTDSPAPLPRAEPALTA